MIKHNIILIDMSNSMGASGVYSYLQCLIKGLVDINKYNVFWINLIQDKKVLFHKVINNDGFTHILIPLPEATNEIIRENYWMDKFNTIVWDIACHHFEASAPTIIHIHTLNNISLAKYIASKLEQSRIITHLHCIPWKDLYNRNMKQFLELYNTYYIDENFADIKPFLTHSCELDSYHESDKVICVTRCAARFLEVLMKVPLDKIVVIPNGMHDMCSIIPHIKMNKHEKVNLLYVGALIASKGLPFILRAVRMVAAKGYSISLDIAGAGSSLLKESLMRDWGDLPINFLGKISREELAGYYQRSDIGIIASVQEQASYVALEMAMFGMPIIVTSVDGLDEMFEDGKNALKIKVTFGDELNVDVGSISDAIISLIENPSFAGCIGKNARKLYEDKLSGNLMLRRTCEVYDAIL